MTRSFQTQVAISAAAERATRLVEDAFPEGRTPRSPEYKSGVYALLLFRFSGRPILCPHDTATAQADAFFAGVEEGKRLVGRLSDR